MSQYVLPELTWDPTHASGDRHGARVQHVVVHRWGVRYTSPQQEDASFEGVRSFFRNPANRASAHVVYEGEAAGGRAAQMVRWSDYAWAEAAYNPTSVEIESADAIWLGHDPHGLRRLARMVAWCLVHWSLPPVWSHERGFCRHADLGAAGGSHPSCPTTDLATWREFATWVLYEHGRGGFRSSWGRD